MKIKVHFRGAVKTYELNGKTQADMKKGNFVVGGANESKYVSMQVKNVQFY